MQLQEIFNNGFHLESFPLPENVKKLVADENWEDLDKCFRILTNPDGALYRHLRTWMDFQSIEFIISVRDAAHAWEEDEIWHDDGSRILAFSLSLTVGTVEGGQLGIRRKNGETFVSIPTPAYGTMIVFLTGVHGYEHKIHRVTKGKRIIIAGWCS